MQTVFADIKAHIFTAQRQRFTGTDIRPVDGDILLRLQRNISLLAGYLAAQGALLVAVELRGMF